MSFPSSPSFLLVKRWESKNSESVKWWDLRDAARSAMDIYEVDQSLGQVLGQPPPPEKTQPEISFDAGSEFNLKFFDSTDDRESTQGGFSDPGSVGSAAPPSPTPTSLVQLQPSSSSSSKSGKKRVVMDSESCLTRLRILRTVFDTLLAADTFNSTYTYRYIAECRQQQPYHIDKYRQLLPHH